MIAASLALSSDSVEAVREDSIPASNYAGIYVLVYNTPLSDNNNYVGIYTNKVQVRISDNALLSCT